MTGATEGVAYPFFNVSATTQISVRSGSFSGISINTVGTTVLAYDSATVGGIGVGNLLVTVNAASLGFQSIELPFQNGLVIVPQGSAVCSGAYT